MGDAGAAGNEADPREMEGVRSAIPAEVEARYMEGCGGTYCMIEQPERTAQVLGGWLARHPAPATHAAA